MINFSLVSSVLHLINITITITITLKSQSSITITITITITYSPMPGLKLYSSKNPLDKVFPYANSKHRIKSF